MGYSLNLNQSIENTISMKLRRNSILTSYIVNDINGKGKRVSTQEQTRYNNIAQMIKRYMVYQTVNPLAFKSTNNSGVLVPQPDINYDLTIVNGTTKKCLFNGSFSDETPTSDQCYIFVYNTSNSYRKTPDGWSTLNFNISIIIPDLYDNVIDADSGINVKRGDMLSILISDLIDEYTIDNNDYVPYVGNVQFKLIGSNVSRLANSGSNVIYTLGYELKAYGGRVD